MPFESKTRRFQKEWLADILDHFVVVACRRAKKSVAKPTRRFEDRAIGRKAGPSEERRFSAVSGGVAGMERLHHRSLLAVNARRCRSGDPKSGLQLRGIQFQHTRAGDGSAKATPQRRAVKAAILDVWTIRGKFAHHLDRKHVSFQQLLAGRTRAFAEAQRGPKQHARWVPHVYKCIPVVVIQRMRQ